MLKLRRLPWVDIILVILLVAAGVYTVNLNQTKASTEQEVTRLENRIKAAKLDLSDARKANESEKASLVEKEASLVEKETSLAEKEPGLAEKEASLVKKEADLEDLRLILEQTKPVVVKSPLLWREEAIPIAEDVIQHAGENDVTLAAWKTDEITISLTTGKYRAIRHNLIIEGRVDALIGFMIDLVHTPTNTPVAPLVQSLGMTWLKEEDTSEVEETLSEVVGVEKGIWRMELELTVAYR